MGIIYHDYKVTQYLRKYIIMYLIIFQIIYNYFFLYFSQACAKYRFQGILRLKPLK